MSAGLARQQFPRCQVHRSIGITCVARLRSGLAAREWVLGSPLFPLRPLAARRRLPGKRFESRRAEGRAASRRFENDIGVRRKEAWRLAGEAKGEADMLAPE